MHRPKLDELPEINCPEGYHLRHFEDGDAAGWNALLDVAFERKEGTSDFDNDMATDYAYRPERVWFICTDDGQIVATASCWQNEMYGKVTSFIHWVAADTEHGGKKLGHWVSLATLHQARREGRLDMTLSTDDVRIPAIKTYLRLGFLPAITDDSHAERWKLVLETMDWPERFEAIIEGPIKTYPLIDFK